MAAKPARVAEAAPKAPVVEEAEFEEEAAPVKRLNPKSETAAPKPVEDNKLASLISDWGDEDED